MLACWDEDSANDRSDSWNPTGGQDYGYRSCKEIKSYDKRAKGEDI